MEKQPPRKGLMGSLKQGLANAQEWNRKRREEAKRRQDEEEARWAEQRRLTAEREAEEKRLADEEANERRQQRHAALLLVLADDFNVLEHDIALNLRDTEIDQLRFAINQVIGENRKMNLMQARSTTQAAASFGGAVGYNAVMNSKRQKYMTAMQYGAHHNVIRTVADLSLKEKGVLSLLSKLNVSGVIPDKYFDLIELCIAYNAGNSQLRMKSSPLPSETPINPNVIDDGIMRQALLIWLERSTEKPQIAVNDAIAFIGTVRNQSQSPEIKRLIEEELNGAKGWMSAAAL